MDAMTVLNRLNTAWRVPVILFLTALLATVSLIFSLFDGTGKLQHRCARIWSRVILLLSRVQVQVQNLDQLDLNRGYVFAANHLSIFDHWAFLACLPFDFRFVAKASLFRWPFLGWHLKRSGNIAVDPHYPRQTLRAYHAVADRIRLGMSFVVYPEGGRTWGHIAPFKRGAFLLARQAQAPIVPVTIRQAHLRLPRGSLIISPGIMQMIIHPPIEFVEYQKLDPQALSCKVRATILGSYQLVSE